MNIITMKVVSFSDLADGIDEDFIDMVRDDVKDNVTFGEACHTLITRHYFFDDEKAVIREHTETYGETVKVWVDRVMALPDDVLIDLET